MSGGLPKLNMKAVDDAAAEKKAKKKEKKTVKERVDRGRALVRQASASLKRGLTPRGSRVERDPEPSQDPSQDYPSQDYGSDSGTEEYPALTGALGPRESVGAVSDTESDTHQSVPSASADTYDPPTPPRPLSNPPTEGTSYAAAAAAPPADDAEPNAEPKDPEMMLPGGDDPEHQGLLKPSEDATAAAVEKKYQEITPAAYEEQVPEAEQEEEVQKEEAGAGDRAATTTASVEGSSTAGAPQNQRADVKRAGSDTLEEMTTAAAVPTTLKPTKPAVQGGSGRAAVPNIAAEAAQRASMEAEDDEEDDDLSVSASDTSEGTSEDSSIYSEGGTPEEAAARAKRAERGDSSKWRNLAIAVAVFAVGAVATEPVLNAVRKRKEEEEEPQAPLAGQEVAHKGRTWGFR
mmetsp:Transcript_8958/g.26816  ORF Transcript_8958/g.26816 Transcript_8958/m.26816 type:complete len:405 (-) Transcript_8958:1283-2497(-)